MYFKGVAFATPRSDLIKLDDIELVDDWGPNMGLTSKVPSVYSYSPPTEAGEQQWGSSLSPKAVAMVNTKLELDVQENKLDELELIIQVLDGTKNLDISEIKRSHGYPEYTWKSPEEIVTDYLTKIFQYLYQRFEVFGDRLRSTILVDVVVTVPVVFFPVQENQQVVLIINRDGPTELRTQLLERLGRLGSTNRHSLT